VSLGVWFTEDLARILASLASAGGPAHGPAYLKALSDFGLAIGACVPIVGPVELGITSSTRRGEVWDERQALAD
jgi:hypothetical protein